MLENMKSESFSTESPYPLEIKNLVKTYAKVEAVKGVSFQINKGEIFGLLGPNGAGKTSIISVIVTLEEATSGSVKLNGFSVGDNNYASKLNVGFVPQEVINHGFFNVSEILHFISGFYGLRKNTERINYLMHELGLYEHREKKVKQLSGGMKRRLMIAKSLVHSPQLLLLDEPTSGVDVDLREQLWKFVLKLKKEGVSILLTTHYLEEAEMLCDRVGIIDKGQIIKIDETKHLIKMLTTRVLKLKLKNSTEFKEYILKPNEALGELLLSLNLDIAKIEDMQLIEGTLQDAFRKIIKGQHV
jgi:ABC-2 type transport system ATP-binding protein